MRNILLLNPKNYYTLQDFNYIHETLGVRSVCPQNALLTVAALIPDEYNIKYLDENIEPLSDLHLDWADMVFITGILIQQDSMLDCMKQAKARGLVVVAGGMQVASDFQKYFDFLDHVFIGESEHTLPVFFDDLKKGTAKKVYQAADYVNMRMSPLPRFDLVDPKDYLMFSIQFSRGCPFNCHYCGLIHFYGRKVRSKTQTMILSEIQAIYNAGFRGEIYIGDDNFHQNDHDFLISVLGAISEWQQQHGYPFKLFTQTDINVAKFPKILDAMKKAGFYAVQIGLESPSMESLKSVNKKWNEPTEVWEKIKAIYKAGIEVTPSIMIGLDGDPINISDLQFEFLCRLCTPRVMISTLVVGKGTRFYNIMKENDRLIHAVNPSGDGNFPLNYRPLTSEAKVLEDRNRLVGKLFSPDNYFLRAQRLLDHLGESFAYPFKRIDEQKVNKAIERFMDTTDPSSYHTHFLDFIRDVKLRSPEKMKKALDLGIYGYQCYMTYKKAVLDSDLYLEKCHASNN